MILHMNSDDYNEKINEIKNAMKDELFLNDLKEIWDDFKSIDLEEGWE